MLASGLDKPSVSVTRCRPMVKLGLAMSEQRYRRKREARLGGICVTRLG